MPSISSPVIRWRNFRLTPLELLIIVLTVLGIIFLISTWNRETEKSAPVANTASIWEQATAASEHNAQLLEQLRKENTALQQSMQNMEQRLRALEQNRPANNSAPSAAANTPNQYTVKTGDTLNSIAQKHNVSVADLRAWNKLAPDVPIKAGQKLNMVPAN